MMMNKKEEQYDVDQTTKDAIADLWKERMNGKYKNDKEGFAKEFI